MDAFHRLYGEYYNPVLKMSLDAIKEIDACDLVLIDGDHNWYTVFNELVELEKRFAAEFPLVIFHDTGWPYGRRDMYYDPSNIPTEHIQEHKKAGLVFGARKLAEQGGFNTHLNHAVESETPRNGVLTGIEDFINQSDLSLELVSYSGMNGLSVLFLSERADVRDWLESLSIDRRLTELLEKDRIVSLFREQELNEKIAKTRHELKSTETLLEQSEQEVRRLRLENSQLKDLAQSMRIKNRLKAAARLTWLREGDLSLLIESLKNDGLASSLVKIKNRLSEGRAGKKPEAGQGRSRIIHVATQSAKETEQYLRKLPVPIPEYAPLVSIIILTRNGKHHLERLFDALAENTQYPNYEVIVVDNASTDDSQTYLDTQTERFTLKVIKNSINESYSRGHNQALKIAQGEYLVMLNNDIKPLNGWLSHLVNTLQKQDRVGCVGAQLIYPDDPAEPLGGLVQHAGIVFEYEYSEILEKDFIRPYNHGYGQNPKIGSGFPVVQRAAVTAACLLVKKSVYLAHGGLDEKYNYGYEDVDFGLTLSRAGLNNYYCPSSVLVHYESSTQKKQPSVEIRDRRIHNMRVFREKWYDYVFQRYFAAKILANDSGYVAERLHIAFAVTDAGPTVAAGDYFTALELATALQGKGCIVSFVTRRGGQWYDLNPDIDVLVSMLDSYDLTYVQSTRKKLLTVAWIRNWPDRWLSNKSLGIYDIVLGSSTNLCEIVGQGAGLQVTLFPIATNPQRFDRASNKDEKYSCDYSFTGNYWGKPRDIELALDPQELNYNFALYGKDWDKVDKFKRFHRGFLQYSDMPKVYANSKVVIDDAVAGITKPYGSVNSRVFDALAAGALVVTSGKIGAEDLFGNLLPSWENGAELNELLEQYLSSESERGALLNRLRNIVLDKHTYADRAKLLLRLLKLKLGLKKSIAIKIPVPNWDEAENWGDYHFGLGLKKYFERIGYMVVLQILPEWNNGDSDDCDVVIVLRGLSVYTPKSHQINFMWNISHPDKVQIEEYNQYDKVYIASEFWAGELSKKLSVPVECMHQCTDPELFYPLQEGEKAKWHHQILFVGNSRKVYRKVLKDLIPCDYELSVYGSNWEGIIDPKYVKANYLANDQLGNYYSAADVLLNDHWDAMKEYGFISNRVFDGLAAGAFMISDRVKGIENLFSESVLCTYESREELHQLLKKAMNDSSYRARIESNAVAPTIAEIANALNIKSRGTVHRYVQSLIDKGHLERHGKGWRGLKLSEDIEAQRYTIPLLGKIAAGQPIEAIEGEEQLNVAEFLIGHDRYGLRLGDTYQQLVLLTIINGVCLMAILLSTFCLPAFIAFLVPAMSEALKNDIKDPETRDLVSYMSDSVESLDFVLTELLDISRLEAKVVTVWDTGEGVTDKELDNIFTEFFQCHNKERASGKGLGLGLSISRRLAELLDHRLSVRSVLGCRVLVVDNESSILKSTEAVLNRWKCVVDIADSFESAIDRLQRGRSYDIYLLDYSLGSGGNGIELLKRLNSLDGRSVPGIIMTGNTQPEFIQASTEAGYTLLHKPVKPAALRGLIMKLAGERSSSMTADKKMVN
ncbi:unnamed protein product [Cyprideis torosa]|uniref:Uncharacterized protein n=1 Tax=Cyprideis torosa TaxID=163714 RepID=A0A7R8W3E6_9CRUS|nr:unnamed protein product [Cyprideis torosa]CAG0878766.1 unnamed protein product [Cyprideis torosa]